MKRKTKWFSGSIWISAIAGLTFVIIAAHADDSKPLGPNVVARQGDVEVTLQDVDAAAAKIPEGDRAGFFDSPKRIESIVGGLLYQRQLAAKAREQKLEKDPLVRQEILQSTDDVLGRVWLENYRKNLKLPDFNVLAQEYYGSHKSEFVQPSNLVVEHVLVSTKNVPKAQAKARIDEVEAAARAHPDQFQELVEKYSDDPSKARNHGRIDQNGSNKLVKEFAAAANQLNTPGEISPVVETEFGYHVIKLIEKTPERQLSYEEISPNLLLTLRRNFIATQLDQYSGELRGKSLQANPDLVASLRTRYANSRNDSADKSQDAPNAKTDDGHIPPAH